MKKSFISLLVLPILVSAAATLNYNAGPAAARSTFYTATTTVACDIPTTGWTPYVAALSEK